MSPFSAAKKREPHPPNHSCTTGGLRLTQGPHGGITRVRPSLWRASGCALGLQDGRILLHKPLVGIQSPPVGTGSGFLK